MISDSSSDERLPVPAGPRPRTKDANLVKRIYNWIFNSNDESEENAREPEILSIKNVNWFINSNGTSHHTNLYRCMTSSSYNSIVIRRGQAFTFSICLDREIDEQDTLHLAFSFGPDPSFTKGTRVKLQIADSNPADTKNWSVRLLSTTNAELNLEVFTPPTAGVGVWNLQLEHQRGESRHTSSIGTDVYILFNPWCKDDPVFFQQESLLEEYILNDSGTIYTGTHHKPQGRPWTYSQFDSRVLPGVMILLEHTKILRTERGSPAKMANAVSKINCLGKKSLMIERKDGNYERATAPYAWSSSAEIFDEYLQEGKPVGYGQCWIFSALTVTICRALGIPCRSVTNYVSASDTNGTLFIDKFFDKRGYELLGENSLQDTLWCFHAWNEVWMTRPDLEKDPELEDAYDRWQAIDTTPHIECPTTYCGPAPVLAIREGKILDYNSGFFYMEVNSDIVHWIKDDSNDYTIIQVNKCHVGRLIVTRNPTKDNDTEDYINLVDNYVKPDSSPEERDIVQTKIRGNSITQKCFQQKTVQSDVHFRLEQVDCLKPGQDVNVKLVTSNDSESDRNITINLAATAVYYTGHHYSKLDRSEGEILLKPKEAQEIILNIPYDDYWPKLREFSIIRTTAYASVRETDYKWSNEDDFQVEKPRLEFTVKEPLVATKACQLEIVFTSPVKTPLTGCRLKVSSPGIKTTNANFLSPVQPLDKLEYTYTFRPKIPGKRTITAVFTSLEYLEVTGSKLVTIN